MKRDKELHVLFVCKYNRFRSKLAEAYFRKINKDRNIKSKSAGIFKGNPLDKDAKITAREMGTRIKGRPRGIDVKLLKWSDVIVILADDVLEDNFKSKFSKQRIITFKIKDSDSKEDNARVAKELKIAMNKLVKMLEK